MTNYGALGFESALAELRTYLDSKNIPHMLIGGLAMAAWQLSRMTFDVDVTVWVAPDDVPAVVEGLMQRFTSRSADPVGFVRQTRTLPLETATGVRVDVLFAGFPFEQRMIERAVDLAFNQRLFRVATREDLILTKIISPRPKDAMDIESILRAAAAELDWDYLMPLAGELAEAIENPAIVQPLIDARSRCRRP